MVSFSNHTKLLLDVISHNRERIRSYLSKKEIVGRNPYGDYSRFFDRAIEELLIGELRRRGYTGMIIGEELGINTGDRRGYIYVDPLDGSLNVARGINYYCVAVAYADREYVENIKSAVVWDIPNDTLYVAEKGRGAYRIRDEKVERLSSGTPYDVILIDVGFTTCEKCLEEIAKIGTFRRLGSIIISSIKVAEGVFEGVFDMGKLKATDIAAPYIIAREAGAYVFVEPRKISTNPHVKLIIGKNEEIFSKLMSIYKKYIIQQY